MHLTDSVQLRIIGFITSYEKWKRKTLPFYIKLAIGLFYFRVSITIKSKIQSLFIHYTILLFLFWNSYSAKSQVNIKTYKLSLNDFSECCFVVHVKNGTSQSGFLINAHHIKQVLLLFMPNVKNVSVCRFPMRKLKQKL